MCTVSLVKITSCLVLKREYVCLTSLALREGLCREWRPDRAFSWSKQPLSHSGRPEAQQNRRAGGQPGLCSHCQAPSCCDPRLPATAPAAVGASWSWKGQLAAGGRPFLFFFLLACVSVGPLGKYLFRRAVSSAVSWSPANRQAVSPRGNLCYLSGRWRSCVGYQCSGEYNPVWSSDMILLCGSGSLTQIFFLKHRDKSILETTEEVAIQLQRWSPPLSGTNKAPVLEGDFQKTDVLLNTNSTKFPKSLISVRAEKAKRLQKQLQPFHTSWKGCRVWMNITGK